MTSVVGIGRVTGTLLSNIPESKPPRALYPLHGAPLIAQIST